MVWRIDFHRAAAKELQSLSRPLQERILRHLRQRIAPEPNPRRLGKPLKGDKATLWRYRVGDYRLICHLDDAERLILVLRVGHRRDVYR